MESSHGGLGYNERVIFLALRIVFNTAFAQLLKLAQTRDRQMLPAAFVNYLVAAVLGGLAVAILRPPAPRPVSLWLGALTGLAYGMSLLGLETAMETSGVSIAVTVLQLAVLVPTLASITRFHEHPNLSQTAGIALAIAALPILSQTQTAPAGRSISRVAMAWTMFLLFFVTGCSGVTMKAFDAYAPRADLLVFTTVLFSISTAVIGVALLVKRVPWGRSAWPVGAAVGLCNLLQLVLMIKALAALPAVVVFPVSSALTIVFSTLLSVRFWGERLDARASVGIGLAAISAVLLNLRG